MLKSIHLKYVFLVILLSLPSLFYSASYKNSTFALGEGVEGIWQINTTRNTAVDLLLPGNPTTGYGWYVKDRQQIKVYRTFPLNLNKDNSTDDYTPNSSAMGAGGMYKFSFFSIFGGKAQVVFEYKRPWESEVIKNITAKFIIAID